MSSDNQSPLDTPPSQSQEMEIPPLSSAASNEVAPKKRGRPAKKQTSTAASSQTINAIIGDNKVMKPTKNGKKNPPGRRKKILNDHKAQARTDRMFDLKKAFRELGALIKPGLSMLLDRSLEKITENPKAHEQLPEFQEIRRQLDDRSRERHHQLDEETAVKAEYALKQAEMQRDYAQRFHECQVADIKDKYLLKAKQEIMKLHPHPIHRVPGTKSEPALVIVDNDSEPERPAHAAKGPGITITAPSTASMGKKTSPSKRRAANEDHPDGPLSKRSALQSSTPNSDRLAIPASLHRASIFGDAPQNTDTQQPPSRATSPEPAGKSTAPDKYGVFIPNKVRRGRGGIPNNRAVVTAWVHFEPHEIDYLKGGLGKDRKFYVEQAPNPTWTKISDCTEEDFNQEIIEKYHLHPKYGIPRASSRHPRIPDTQTDFSKPPAHTEPLRFVTKDGKHVHDTSRSTRIIYIEQEWKLFMSRTKMGNALREMGADEPFQDEMENVQREQQEQVDKEDSNAAVSAILDAAFQIEADELVAKKEAEEVVQTAPQIDHQSQPQFVPGGLEALADAAETFVKVSQHTQPPQPPQQPPQQIPQPPPPPPPPQPQPLHHHHHVQQPEYAQPPPPSQVPHPQHHMQHMSYADAPYHPQQSQQVQQHAAHMPPMHHMQEQQIHHPQHPQHQHQQHPQQQPQPQQPHQSPQQPMSYTYPSPSAPVPAPMVGYNPQPAPYLPPILPPPQMMGPPPFQSAHFSPPMSQSRHRELRPAPPQGGHGQRHYTGPANTLPPYMGPVVQPGYPGAPPPTAPSSRQFGSLPPPQAPPSQYRPGPWNNW